MVVNALKEAMFYHFALHNVLRELMHNFMVQTKTTTGVNAAVENRRWDQRSFHVA